LIHFRFRFWKKRGTREMFGSGLVKLRRERTNPLVPMNAMSDVAFLLLIFIMLASFANFRREVKIEYPEAESAAELGAEKKLEIWIDRGGAFYLDGIPAELAAIENILGEAYRRAPETAVHVIADKNTPYAKVNQIVEMLKLLEYRAVMFAAGDDE
jgi:biopolymer transport protein ExbD